MSNNVRITCGGSNKQRAYVQLGQICLWEDSERINNGKKSKKDLGSHLCNHYISLIIENHLETTINKENMKLQ
jgi:hypothetical protein